MSNIFCGVHDTAPSSAPSFQRTFVMKVICLASPVLRKLILGTPEGQLPLLHGRYRTWEEVGFSGLPGRLMALSLNK